MSGPVRTISTDRSNSAHSFGNRDAHVRLLMKNRDSEFLTKQKLRYASSSPTGGRHDHMSTVNIYLVNAILL